VIVMRLRGDERVSALAPVVAGADDDLADTDVDDGDVDGAGATNGTVEDTGTEDAGLTGESSEVPPE
jgi:hypothetical protein